ncbi:MAG: hypothetical protein LQ352_008372 [Teloschistes flavicans]|nr:MAG: hypothetical protein LQ352_008372 [Teloschistes flavicans]
MNVEKSIRTFSAAVEDEESDWEYEYDETATEFQGSPKHLRTTPLQSLQNSIRKANKTKTMRKATETARPRSKVARKKQRAKKTSPLIQRFSMKTVRSTAAPRPARPPSAPIHHLHHHPTPSPASRSSISTPPTP